jgi:hypothetical protein
LCANLGQVLEAQRLHSPLSNGYARQWEKQSHKIADEMIRLNKNNSSESTLRRLAARSEIILHALSALPDKFGVCNDEEEILRRLKNIISLMDSNDRDKVAQLSLRVQSDPDGCNAARIIDKLSFAFALNRVIRYLAAGDAPFQNYDQNSFKADIGILASFAREKAILSGVRYKVAQEGLPRPEHEHRSFISSFDLTHAPLSNRAEHSPSSPRKREKVLERPRAQTGEPRSVVPANSPRELERYGPHKIPGIAADQQKITPRQERNAGKSPKIPALDLDAHQESPTLLKSPKRHSQKLNILNDRSPQYTGDAKSSCEETGEEGRRISRSSPDTGKAPYGGRKVAEHRKSQDLSRVDSQPVTPGGRQIPTTPAIPMERVAERPVGKVITLPDLSTVLRAGLSNENSPAQNERNSDAATDDGMESFVFDSIRLTLNGADSISPIKTIYPVKSEGKTLQAQSDNGADGERATVERQVFNFNDGTKKYGYGSTSTSSTD